MRLEGRGALDQALSFGHVEGQQQKLKLGGQLVLAPLPRNLHRKSETLPPKNTVEYRQCHLSLIGT